jgi:predicted transcriptional regulator
VSTRTTLTIDDDVLDKAKSVAAKLHTPVRQVINEALRAGLETVEAPAKRRSYRTKPHKMGLRTGRNLDNIQELLAQVEGEEFR